MAATTLSKLGRAIVEPSFAVRAVWRRVTERVDTVWFPYFERVGIHTKKVHFYSPIPDTRSLPAELWERRSALAGIDFDLERQVELAESLARFGEEFKQFPVESDGHPQHFYLRNGMYESVDAEVLYGMVRQGRPKRIIEIGSGFSTLLASSALARNAAEGVPGSIVSIEPYPRDFLHGVPHLDEIIERPVQDVPLSEFESLGDGDILFIDSSHVAKVGSDVCYELLEIVPRLRPGVLVHVHDIFFPEEYPRYWIMERHYFWNEQYLLQAFLAFNNSFETIWCGRYMHLMRPDVLQRAFPTYPRHTGPQFPSSFWMRRVR
jgi:predicted O-methyltransferase YrrM